MNHISLAKISTKKTFLSGEPAYDVMQIGRHLEDFVGHYELDGFDDSGVVYYDGNIVALTHGSMGCIQSIGVRNSDGKIIASLVADLYGDPDYKCIWLF